MLNETEIPCVRRRLDALASLGVPAIAAGRNDLHVDGKKISGAAYKQNSMRAFHHGKCLCECVFKILKCVVSQRNNVDRC